MKRANKQEVRFTALFARPTHTQTALRLCNCIYVCMRVFMFLSVCSVIERWCYGVYSNIVVYMLSIQKERHQDNKPTATCKKREFSSVFNSLWHQFTTGTWTKRTPIHFPICSRGVGRGRNRGATVAYLLRYAIVLALVRSTPDLGKLQGLDVCADDGAVQFQLLLDHLDVHGRDRVRKRRVYHPDCTRMYTHIFCD